MVRWLLPSISHDLGSSSDLGLGGRRGRRYAQLANATSIERLLAVLGEGNQVLSVDFAHTGGRLNLRHERGSAWWTAVQRTAARLKDRLDEGAGGGVPKAGSTPGLADERESGLLLTRPGPYIGTVLLRPASTSMRVRSCQLETDSPALPEPCLHPSRGCREGAAGLRLRGVAAPRAA